jgi:5'-3' exonuclease
MGVPKFFAWLMKKYKNSNFIFEKEKSNDEIVSKIDWLLIDTNCLIHPVCFKILAEEIEKKININHDKLENKMINAVIEYIDKIIKYTDPKKGVYLAIDGPVCCAKMKQQRQRRFRSYHDKLLYDNIKKKHNIPETYFWSNSAISPGTKFMNKLHIKILDYCSKQTIKINYSSSNTPGEGEHKLLDFIKKNNKSKKKLSYVTYGLDADLIFLMLVTKLDNVYLLREAQQFDGKKDDRLNFVSLKIMRSCILDTFQNASIILEFEKDRIINDFVFLCYFLGNDFLPHLHSLDIGTKGIEYLIEKYVETFKEIIVKKERYLLSEDTLTINQTFLQIFISKVSLNEEHILTKNYNKKKFHHYSNEDPYKKELEKIDNLLFKIEDPIGLGVNSNYRFNYYNYYFGVTEEELEEFVKELVKNYLIGVRWSTYYYFQEIPDWNWYYPYDYPPFLSDINKYIIDINEITFNKGNPISPLQQLLIILPQQMSFLLPKALAKITTNTKSSLAHLYPLDFYVDFLYKHKYYEGIPWLPNMENSSVIHIFNKYKNELNAKEKERDRIDTVFEFNH